MEPEILYNVTVLTYDGYYSDCGITTAPYTATTSTAGIASFLDVPGPIVKSSVPMQGMPCADTFTNLMVPYEYSTVADVDVTGTDIVMNTLTTLMTTIYETTPGATPASAANTVLTSLGLPATINLATFDAIEEGDTPDGVAALGTMAKVSAIVVQGASMLQGSLATDASTAAAALFSSLANLATNAVTPIDVTSATSLESIFSSAVTEVTGVAPSAAVLATISDVAAATSNLNALIDQAIANGFVGNELVVELSKYTIVSQTVMAEATEDLADGTINPTTYGSATTPLALVDTATSVSSQVNRNAINGVHAPKVTPIAFPFFVTDDCDKDEWKWPCQNAKIMVGVFASLGGCLILAAIFLATRGGKGKVVSPAT